MLAGERYGYFAPTYKLLTEVFEEVSRTVYQVGKANKTEKRIELITGGIGEFWTLEDPDAGRSRKYHEAGIDEAGMVGGLEQVWFNAIRPTLVDYRGGAWFAGTPKGQNYFCTAFNMGQDPLQTDWRSWQEPTTSNPYIPAEEVEAAREGMPERSFRQEFLAEFIEESGGVFRSVREAINPTLQNPGNPIGQVSIGIDLARVEDFTVITAVDSNGTQVYLERFNQISWERQIERIKAVAGMYPGSKLLLDSTGIGDPIFEQLRKLGLRVEGYQLSNTSKEQLIDNLAMLIEQSRIHLLNDAVQSAEMMAYQYELTPSRNVRMNAPAGMHDDTVIALALAAWPLRAGGRSWDGFA